MNNHSLFDQAQSLLVETSTSKKCQGVFQLYWRYHQGRASLEAINPPEQCVAGIPADIKLVPPKDCAARDFKTHQGRIGLIHALAHIEFNAINLALDACVRFQGMPKQYYEDWLQVAKEEAYHFTLLQTHLNAMGADYGDLSAHNGLWVMAQRTAHDVVARMGCVPRLLEARGLDVAPIMATKLKKYDANAATLLDIIMRDEETHVLIGNRWFNYVCEQRGLEPLSTFKSLVEKYAPGTIRPPIEREARARAGFKEDELDWIESVVL